MTPETERQPESIPKDRKTRQRSPNYPCIGLLAAVEKIKTLYAQDRLAASPKDAALKHLGYEKSHGEAGRVLSALKSFGLIEEANDRVKLSQRGIDIVVRDVDDVQRVEAMRAAVTGPEAYRDLLKAYQDSLPSNTTLKSELIAVRRFNPNAVDGFIRDFRDSLDFSGLSTSGGVEFGLENQEAMPAAPEQSIDPLSVAPQVAKIKPILPSPPPTGAPISLLAQTLPISIPRNLRVDIQVRGDELKKDDLARIKSQINRWLEGLDEAFE